MRGVVVEPEFARVRSRKQLPCARAVVLHNFDNDRTEAVHRKAMCGTNCLPAQQHLNSVCLKERANLLGLEVTVNDSHTTCRHGSCASAGMVHPYTPYCASFSYTGKYRYLLTFVTFARNVLFTEEQAVSLVWEQFLRACAEKQFEVLAYCFMPDHVHLIVEGMSDESDLKLFVKLAKQYSGYYYRRTQPNRTLAARQQRSHRA